MAVYSACIAGSIYSEEGQARGNITYLTVKCLGRQLLGRWLSLPASLLERCIRPQMLSLQWEAQ